MQIYLLRHGIAEPHAASDSERDLIEEGRQKLRQVLRVAAKAGVAPSLILSSPYKRALATAKIAAETLGYKGEIVRSQALLPDAALEEVWQEIRAHRREESLLLSGHEPQFSSLGAYLLGVPELAIDFKKGALLAIEIPEFGVRPRGALKWMLTAKLAG